MHEISLEIDEGQKSSPGRHYCTTGTVRLGVIFDAEYTLLCNGGVGGSVGRERGALVAVSRDSC